MTGSCVPVHLVGTPEAWAATVNDAEEQSLCAAFDEFNARVRQLQQQVDQWKREAATIKDRAGKARLVAQSHQFQQTYAAMAVEHDALQRRNVIHQERLRGGN